MAVIVAVCAWGLAIAAFGLMTEGMFALALVLVALAEAADVLSAIFRNVILQGAVREELRGRLTAIHGLFVIGGPNLGQVRAGLHGAQDGREPIEVETLRGSQRMLFEERNHDLHEIAPALHGEAKERLTMVVVAGTLDDRSAPELLEEELERGA